MGSPAIYDPTVRVHSGFDYDPDMDGSLNTIAISIIREEHYISRQYLYSLRQSNLASDGSLVLESTETNTQIEVKPIGYFADADASKKSRETSFTESIEDQEQRRLLQQEQRRKIIEQEMKQQAELASKMMPDPLGYNFEAERIVPSWINLPMGVKSASKNYPNPGSSDWLNKNQIYQMMICAAFSLPKTLVFSEGQRTTHDE